MTTEHAGFGYTGHMISHGQSLASLSKVLELRRCLPEGRTIAFFDKRISPRQQHGPVRFTDPFRAIEYRRHRARRTVLGAEQRKEALDAFTHGVPFLRLLSGRAMLFGDLVARRLLDAERDGLRGY